VYVDPVLRELPLTPRAREEAAIVVDPLRLYHEGTRDSEIPEDHART
jgi:hypothetical protein